MKCVHYFFYKQKIFGNFWSTVNKNETALIFSIWIHFFKEKKLKLAKFVNFNEILCFFFFFFQIGSASGMFMKVFQVSEPKNEFSFSTMFIVFELHTFFFLLTVIQTFEPNHCDLRFLRWYFMKVVPFHMKFFEKIIRPDDWTDVNIIELKINIKFCAQIIRVNQLKDVIHKENRKITVRKCKCPMQLRQEKKWELRLIIRSWVENEARLLDQSFSF